MNELTPDQWTVVVLAGAIIAMLCLTEIAAICRRQP